MIPTRPLPRRRGRVVPAAILAMAAGPAGAEPPSLVLPVDCELGETCYVQKYVDRAPGPSFVDVGCGALGEDGHNGTDFALPALRDLERGVPVIAAAPGVVLGRRDGMPDIAVTDARAPDVEGRECGNGVSIDHGDGWTTQYCHMAQGSIAVEVGQEVERGETLGEIGLSGSSEYPHVHMSVRRDGEPVDPFDVALGTCGEGPGEPLWAEPLDYVSTGVIAAGVLDRVPEYDEVKAGLDPPPGDAAAPLVLWAYAFGAQPGDVMRFVLEGPDGVEIDSRQEIDRRQIAYFRADGRRAPEGGWTPGRYEGRIDILRDGEAMDGAPVSAEVE